MGVILPRIRVSGLAKRRPGWSRFSEFRKGAARHGLRSSLTLPSTLRREEFAGAVAIDMGGAVDAVDGDRQQPVLAGDHPALLLQVPDVKFQMLGRATREA